MNIFWTLVAIALVFAIFWVGARWIFGGYFNRRVMAGGDKKHADKFPRRDLNANINPSQLGNEVDLWPDRTGARTRKELGARKAADVTYAGDREEHKGVRDTAKLNQAQGATEQQRPANDRTATGVVQSDPAKPFIKPGIRREAQPGPHEHGPGTQAKADLAPEDHYGEDRPASRDIAPDQNPTQWHPREHGVPGDHYRNGHHRSATGPERRSDAKDPYAHAPVPGPNHIPPEAGQELPPGTQP